MGETKVRVIFRVVLLTLAGTYIYGMSTGIRNNYGIMLNPIIENSGISFTTVSFILAVGQLVYGLVQPMFGLFAAKKGHKCTLLIGVVFIVAGLLLKPFCKSTLSLLITLGFILPIGTGAISYGIIMEVITPKIPTRLVSIVSGIVNASIGIGNAVLSPAINSVIKAGGLMHGMIMLSIPTLLILPVTLLIGRKDNIPASAGAAHSPLANAEPTHPKELFKRAFGSRTYIYLLIGFFICSFHCAIVTTHLPTAFQAYGFSSDAAAYAFSLYGVTTVMGSVICGALCGRFKLRTVLAVTYAIRPFTILFFLLAPKSLFVMTTFTVLLGFTSVSTVPPVSGLISRYFGVRSLATLFGFVFLMHQAGGFVGAWTGGLWFNMAGNYTGIWVINLVVNVLAAAISYAIRETPEEA